MTPTTAPGGRRRGGAALISILTLVASVAATACSAESETSEPAVGFRSREAALRAFEGSPGAGTGSSLLPYSGPVDAVSFGKFVAVVEVVGETEIDEGDAFIGRSVDIEIEEVLWTAADTDVPRDLAFISWGWMDSEEGRFPLADGYGLRLEVQGRYLVIFTDFGYGDRFAPMAQGATYELDSEGRIVASPRQPGADFFDGLTPEAAGAVLGSTAVDPAAVPFMDIKNPIERWRRVSGVLTAGQDTGSAESD